MTHYTGGCLCGAVRIEIAAAPYRVGICHCLDCRKRQGAIGAQRSVAAIANLIARLISGLLRRECRHLRARQPVPIRCAPLRRA